nr:MAG TPA: hypothetical protein [Caudoviricetes sp.]DAK45520.1 MAG TPA: hypothetical protein [Inoviridae sp.]DAS54987.1 MAG TPA: hypothetical protein [Caudoviricetes sp.]
MVGCFQTPTVFAFCVFIDFKIHKVSPMNEYTFSYRFDGKSWSLSIWADSPEEARAKFRAAQENAQYDGEVVTKIYTFVNISWVKKLYRRIKYLMGIKE